MYILPIALATKNEKVFYFTFFINVFGAFIALLMPNFTLVNFLNYDVVIFYVVHYYAFAMPILLVALGIFERPKLKQWIYSVIWFGVYFASMLILNAWFTNYDPGVDFFFLNSNKFTNFVFG